MSDHDFEFWIDQIAGFCPLAEEGVIPLHVLSLAAQHDVHETRIAAAMYYFFSETELIAYIHITGVPTKWREDAIALFDQCVAASVKKRVPVTDVINYAAARMKEAGVSPGDVFA